MINYDAIKKTFNIPAKGLKFFIKILYPCKSTIFIYTTFVTPGVAWV